ncbi:MAG: 30S ribosomal protein S17 [Thermoplasmata archaeon]|nr:30S ribosomal protein S17 [Thermoplasmata archaeon]
MKAERKFRDIGVDVEEPKNECDDKNCPFHGNLPVRGQTIEGTVVSDKMEKSIVVGREYFHYIPKYERYEKRKSRYLAHSPPCLEIKVGDMVRLMECRPLSKNISHVAIEVKR